MLTFKTQQTLSPQYLSQHISLRTSACNTRSSSVPLLCVPFRRTSFARRSFSTAAPLTWNSLPPAVLNCDSLSQLSNPDLKLICFLPLSANYSTYLFRQRLCSRLMALWRYINFALLLLLLLKNPKKQKTSHVKGSAKSGIWRAETTELIATKCCMLGAMQDVIT